MNGGVRGGGVVGGEVETRSVCVGDRECGGGMVGGLGWEGGGEGV